MVEEDAPPPYHVVGPGDHHGVLLSTADDFPGYEIITIHGIVFGTYVCRSSSGFRTDKMSKDGEFVRYRAQAVKGRERATQRVIDGVVAAGGNAAYAVRFEVSNPEQFKVEVTCYGTAVTIVPKSAAATAGNKFSQMIEKS